MTKIKIQTSINANIKDVWKHWNDSQSIQNWAFASDDWECPYAENDLKVGGCFLTRMSAKDKSMSFDFTGTYMEVIEFSKIKYRMDKSEETPEQRECEIIFTIINDTTVQVEEEFDAEEINSEELQKAGWTAILNNFKKFVEQG